MENGKYLNHGIPGPRGSELKGISVPFSAYFWYSVVNSPSNVFVDEVPNYLDDFDRHEFLKTMSATCQKTAWVRLTQVGWTEADLEKESKGAPAMLETRPLRKETL
ncbi:MAG: hypothetical protein JWM99_3730 [Verrucomicrobiales bacterium]|nr:hypothetical protein [Verrucomicrobiales bacterium]